MKTKTVNKIMGGIFLTIGCLIVLFFVYNAVKSIVEYSKAESTTATVTSARYTGMHIEEIGSGKSRTKRTYYDYTYGIKYTVDGKEYNNCIDRSYTTKDSGCKEGSTMTIEYSSNNPMELEYKVDIVAYIIGAVFGSIFIFIGCYTAREKKDKFIN